MLGPVCHTRSHTPHPAAWPASTGTRASFRSRPLPASCGMPQAITVAKFLSASPAQHERWSRGLSIGVNSQHMRCGCAGDGGLTIDQEAGAQKDDYNRRMQEKMGWDASPYEYHYERGLYYHEVWKGEGGGSLICGTMPRNVQDLDYLHLQDKVNVVVNLQENKDFHYWNVDFHSIYWRSVSHGITIERVPAVDFDPDSLRYILPDAVKVVAEAMTANKKVYVHCTAGLGRAPAVCIAYLYWWCGMGLEDAYSHLTSIRPCGPKKEAIRGATFDLLEHNRGRDFSQLPSDACATLSLSDRETLQAAVLARRSE